MNEARVNTLVDLLETIVVTSGDNENTSIYPNAEVINATPATLPAGYVIVEDDRGFYVPAVLVSGLSVSNGDKVNLLYIKGTEPIAFQHGTGSSGGGGGTGAWPQDNKAMINTTEYATITLAIAAASSGDTIKIGAGTFTEAFVVDTPNVTLVGTGPLGATKITSAEFTTIAVSADNVKLANLDIECTGTGALAIGVAFTVASITTRVERCRAVQTGAATVGYGFYVTNGTVHLIDCIGTSDTSNLGYGLLATGGSSVVYVRDGVYSGDDGDIGSGISTTINLAGPRLANDKLIGPNNFGYWAGTATYGPFRVNDAGITTLEVTNTSGSAASSSDVGIINDLANYTTTTTANDTGRICVVVTGGANNDEIVVAVRGKITCAYTGTAPNAGEYLVTSATAGFAQVQVEMRPEVFARAESAGLGGSVEVVLLTHTKFRSMKAANDLVQMGAASNSDFRTTINGAPSGTSVTYTDPPTSGAEDTINIASSSEWGKIRLYNETRTNYALISSVNTTTNVITVTDATDISTWQSGDTITTRSQTNSGANAPGGNYFYDIEIVAVSLPEFTRFIEVEFATKDTGGGGYAAVIHPWTTFTTSFQTGITSNSAQFLSAFFSVPLIEKRFTIGWQASGSGTRQNIVRLAGVWEAMP